MDNIADKPVFADGYDQKGLTYRQWLIGMAISGSRDSCLSPRQRAKEAIEAANEVLLQMEEFDDYRIEFEFSGSKITCYLDFKEKTFSAESFTVDPEDNTKGDLSPIASGRIV